MIWTASVRHSCATRQHRGCFGLLLWLSVAMAAVADDGARHVLLFTVSDYRQIGGYGPPSAVPDGWKATLDSAGFQVESVSNPSFPHDFRLVEFWSQKVAPGADVLVLVSGILVAVDGRNLLLPPDFDPTGDSSLPLARRGFPLARLLRLVAQVRPARVILLVDGCSGLHIADPAMGRSVEVGPSPGEDLFGAVGGRWTRPRLAGADRPLLLFAADRPCIGEVDLAERGRALEVVEQLARETRDTASLVKVLLAQGWRNVAAAGEMPIGTDATVLELPALTQQGNAVHSISEPPAAVAPSSGFSQADAGQSAPEPDISQLVESASSPEELKEVPVTKTSLAPAALPQPSASATPDPLQRSDRNVEAVLTTSQRCDIQHALRDLGFEPGGVDGIFGPGTERALRQFQRDRGHTETGWLTAQQRDVLLAHSAKIAQSRPRCPRPMPRPVITPRRSPKPPVSVQRRPRESGSF
ncbi:MAG: hypothetical protein N838_25160 [Thiohalocapsa sp. PB-PSB1]|jgi:hypothetical protein|nr:MAG: hypothetical protein N838_19940 [Thiohalocapsa sp. PB-PSB1]QQO56154.1 MAG: hypothetical protein N838_25160 [Thiohalocapsa sp. PB-PSB1]